MSALTAKAKEKPTHYRIMWSGEAYLLMAGDDEVIRSGQSPRLLSNRAFENGAVECRHDYCLIKAEEEARAVRK